MAYYVKEEFIREFPSQKVIGILRTLPNGDQEAREFSSRRILGFYRAAKDMTTDFYGRVIARGNCVTGLIYDAHLKHKGGHQA